MSMIIVGVREAKVRFSELIDHALSGEKVIIMRRGEPVAYLERLSDEDRARLETTA